MPKCKKFREIYFIEAAKIYYEKCNKEPKADFGLHKFIKYGYILS